MHKLIKELENLIMYNFKDKSLLHRALTHKSYDNVSNNEKLEFLGDRVLGLVISKTLLEKFQMKKRYNCKYANLVNKKTCVKHSQKNKFKKISLFKSLTKH